MIFPIVTIGESPEGNWLWTDFRCSPAIDSLDYIWSFFIRVSEMEK